MIAIALTCSACSDSANGDMPTGGAGTHAAGASGEASGGTGGETSGGTSGAATGGTGGEASGGTSGAATGGTGGEASGGAGGMQSTDPCAGRPASCIELCEGGSCTCSCPDADPCPSAEPAEGSACNTVGVCGFGEPACHRVLECFDSKWKLVGETCSDPAPGTCPATLEDAMATPCIERPCGYEGVICTCAPPACSGALLDPVTQCNPPTPAVCTSTSPADGKSCSPEGQQCGSSCCGLLFTCTNGRWSSLNRACPP